MANSDGRKMKAAVIQECQGCQEEVPAVYLSYGRAGVFLCACCVARILDLGDRCRMVSQESRHCQLHSYFVFEYVCMERECSEASILCEMCKCEKHLNHDCVALNRAADLVRAELQGLIKIIRGLCEPNEEMFICAASGNQLAPWTQNADAELNDRRQQQVPHRRNVFTGSTFGVSPSLFHFPSFN